MKKAILRSVSHLKAALGLPHTKTKNQVLATRASFDEEEIARERIDTIASATASDPSDIRQWITMHEEWVDGIADYADGAGTPMSGRDQKTLFVLLRAIRPALCVETGTGVGASASVILSVLEEAGHGKLYSLDLERRGVGVRIPQEYSYRFEQRFQTNGIPALPRLLDELGTIDLFLHDSLHTVGHMTWEYETAWPYLRSGGCLCSHDVIYSTSFQDFHDKHGDEISAGGVIGNFGFWIKK